uniref:Uncharacterized protein n=1 Tax=Globodera pallida TaxID=36090 RepID=A0A183BTH1_GLOPA
MGPPDLPSTTTPNARAVYTKSGGGKKSRGGRLIVKLLVLCRPYLLASTAALLELEAKAKTNGRIDRFER